MVNLLLPRYLNCVVTNAAITSLNILNNNKNNKNNNKNNNTSSLVVGDPNNEQHVVAAKRILKKFTNLVVDGNTTTTLVNQRRNNLGIIIILSIICFFGFLFIMIGPIIRSGAYVMAEDFEFGKSILELDTQHSPDDDGCGRISARPSDQTASLYYDDNE